MVRRLGFGIDNQRYLRPFCLTVMPASIFSFWLSTLLSLPFLGFLILFGLRRGVAAGWITLLIRDRKSVV